MVIVQVPYTLCYTDEARIYHKLTSTTPSFRQVHLDPHALQVAAVFAILTRLKPSTRPDLDLNKKLRIHAHEAMEGVRSEEHKSELQSLMRISYAVFCLKKKNINIKPKQNTNHP